MTPARRTEVADVFRKHGTEYLATYRISPQQYRVLHSVAYCRTEAFGGHKNVYSCGHEQIAYNSCLDRHCPKCQGSARRKWLDAQAADLLDVRYFHVVFTLPNALASLALQNPRELYGHLFRAAADTLLVIGRDPKHLGADLGFLSVLHTWGQNLHLHPHLHCVVPGGGISPDGSRWVPCRKRFFLPVRVLSRLFRAKFLQLLREAQAKGRLRFAGKLAPLADPDTWQEFLRSLCAKEWVVYAKPPFGGPRQVLKYLARYTHRVAISNHRILSFQDGKVTFRWKDYADSNRQKTMTLPAVEFIRRFLQHVLPERFVRIRHYGFLANSIRREKLVVVRRLLATREQASDASIGNGESPIPETTENDPTSAVCPICRKGHLVEAHEIHPVPTRFILPRVRVNTS